MAPSFRLLALLGHGRGADRDGRPLSRRGAHRARRSRASPRPRASASTPRPRPTSTCCAMPSTCWPRRSARRPRGWCCRCCCASARSRPRPRCKLLDDANAAIQYNREILQTALDHVRQGIAVFDKDLRLICWNRQFGEMLDLPPSLARVGIGLDEILRHNAERGALRRRATSTSSSPSGSRSYVGGASRSCERFADAAWSSRCAPTACRTAASSPPTPTSRRASRRPRRWNAPTRRSSGACASAPRS